MTDDRRTDDSRTASAGARGGLGAAPSGMPDGFRATTIPDEPTVRWWVGDGSASHEEIARACRHRALLLWPRLDASRLARTRGDPWRIARLVAARTPRSLEDIVAMVTRSASACPVPPARGRRSASRTARAGAGG